MIEAGKFGRLFSEYVRDLLGQDPSQTLAPPSRWGKVVVFSQRTYQFLGIGSMALVIMMWFGPDESVTAQQIREPAGRIVVLQEKEDLSFGFFRERMTGSFDFERAEAVSLTVRQDSTKQTGKKPIIWHIQHVNYASRRAEPKGAAKITYGEVPDEFVQLEPRAGFAPVLAPNERYSVWADVGVLTLTHFTYRPRMDNK